jgi:GDP-L-fucose synthase
MVKKDTKIYVAGHRGMLGSAVWSALEKRGYMNLVAKTSAQLDLTNQQAVKDFYATEKPEIVIAAAARVGGILANSNFPYQFLMENLQIQNNLMDGALQADRKKCKKKTNRYVLKTVCLQKKNSQEK